jgi:flagellar biosynthesis protein FliP
MKGRAMRMDAQIVPSFHRLDRVVAVLLLILLSATSSAQAQEISDTKSPAAVALPTGPNVSPLSLPGVPVKLPDLTQKENLSSAMQIIILLTVLSLAPAILLMMTSFTRIIIVLSLLRQAMGTQSLPPNQILIGLAMFMTFLIMKPTWDRVNSEALAPYMAGTMDQKTALVKAQAPLREFMQRQIEHSENVEDVDLFTNFAGQPRASNWSEVGTTTLIPAFMLSELKTAFLLGFKVYLPFLIIDMVISTVLISMGMMMLPPALIALPFKLLLFVLVDGWHLITGSLMSSFVN